MVGTVAAVAAPSGCGYGWFLAGALVVTFFVLLDLLDGAVARAGGRTTFGAVLDSTSDRLADAAVFTGIGWYFAAITNLGCWPRCCAWCSDRSRPTSVPVPKRPA